MLILKNIGNLEIKDGMIKFSRLPASTVLTKVPDPEPITVPENINTNNTIQDTKDKLQEKKSSYFSFLFGKK